MAPGPLARYAALANFVELSTALSADPAAMMRAVGLDPAGLAKQDRWIPASSVARLLERAAVATGRPDFGLRLGELRRLSHLGPLSMVIREEPDVRSALDVLIRYEHLYNEALHVRVHEHAAVATVSVEIALDDAPVRQSVELAVAVLHRLVQGFVGRHWQPLGVDFTHPAPQGPTIHHRVLGPAVHFGRERNGLTLYATDLHAPNAMADPQLREYTAQLVGPLTPSEADIVSRVHDLVEMLLPTGQCSVEQVARSLGVDRRTVHRHLAREGETFSSVVESTRHSLAGQLVRHGRRPLAEVAELVGFSSHSNFTRWFRRSFGTNPARWRRRPE
ncbi:AraC family transcriptional regulator [Pseudonocardia sp. GCM10023141]|uniref:AraC family transcriptional regulator n=1 Tax=Pseudonocardia sp. GCM10023141 TaxID=3252653 RepID=UPI00361B3C31